jgi:DNA-binding MarR family transcriptional regulator
VNVKQLPMSGDEPALAMARTIKRARAALVEGVAARLRTNGRAGMRAAHMQVFEHLDPDGTRMTILAARAHMTHQAMSELVAELVNLGYLERVPDPVDHRARLVRPTRRGLEELARATRLLRDIRDRWQHELNGEPVEHVLQALEALIRVCDQNPTKRLRRAVPNAGKATAAPPRATC